MVTIRIVGVKIPIKAQNGAVQMRESFQLWEELVPSFGKALLLLFLVFLLKSVVCLEIGHTNRT
jgi:hypothetical protein